MASSVKILCVTGHRHLGWKAPNSHTRKEVSLSNHGNEFLISESLHSLKHDRYPSGNSSWTFTAEMSTAELGIFVMRVTYANEYI